MRSLIAIIGVSASVMASGHEQAMQAGVAANPIRKVVNMLQAMQQKVSDEGETEKKLYADFMCYCKTGGSDLTASIAAAKTKLGELATDIEVAGSKFAKTKEELESAQTDRAAGQKAMEEATSIRENEAATYAKFKADSEANLAALNKAIVSIESGMAGGFLQTEAASVLRHVVKISSEMDDDSRQMLTSFLSGSQGYNPQSGQITGILKTMHDEMSAAYAEATAAEKASVQAYEELMASKLKEKAALTQAIETKSEKIGELGVAIAEMKNDAGDTGEALEADQKFLAQLETGCATKTAEWNERSKTRTGELAALADTIKILNDDDALELFKKTLPSPSVGLVQLKVSTASLRASALTALRRAQTVGPSERVGLDLIALALHGKKIGFEKVIAMIDGMVTTLKKEQVDDDNKKAYCAEQLDTSDDKAKSLKRKIGDLDTAIATAKENMATLTEEIASLKAGIAKLDKSVAEATANRKKEHEEYSELIASNSAAKEILALAVNRLQQFYNPKLAKAETPALVHISSHSQGQAAPAPPPQTWGAYQTKHEKNGGVVQMINLLVGDLDKEMTEGETEEKDAQADYEALMKDSADKRRADSKSLSEKEAAKADTEAALESHSDDKESTAKELLATQKYVQMLHTDCDWLIKYFDVRQQARADEVDALKSAKAVLSGADYSLLQTAPKGFLRRH
jgi:hypothetical protein